MFKKPLQRNTFRLLEERKSLKTKVKTALAVK